MLRLISGVSTPPSVSMPSDSGVTSSSSTSDLLPEQQLRPLDGRADGHHLVRVDALVPFLAEDLLHQLLHARHARHAADQHDLVDLAGLSLASLQRRQHRPLAALDQVLDHLLELAARDRHLQVLRARLASAVMNGRLMSVLRLLRQVLLGPLGRFLEPLQGHRVLAQVDAVLLLELVGDVVDQHLVEVVAAQVRVAVGRLAPRRRRRPTSRMEMSNVPPPRSKTAIFSSFFLSRP